MPRRGPYYFCTISLACQWSGSNIGGGLPSTGSSGMRETTTHPPGGRICPWLVMTGLGRTGTCTLSKKGSPSSPRRRLPHERSQHQPPSDSTNISLISLFETRSRGAIYRVTAGQKLSEPAPNGAEFEFSPRMQNCTRYSSVYCFHQTDSTHRTSTSCETVPRIQQGRRKRKSPYEFSSRGFEWRLYRTDGARTRYLCWGKHSAITSIAPTTLLVADGSIKTCFHALCTWHYTW